MIQVPESFEKALKAYDPLLRLRYGAYVKQYVIERIGRVSEGEARLLRFAASRENAEPKALEEWESAREGRRVIHYTMYLDQRVHDYLWNHDLQKQGYKVLNRFMREKAARKMAGQAQAHETTREVVNVMSHLLKRKSSAIHQGKADDLVREAFHLPARPEPKKGADFSKQKPATGLVDQFGRDLAPRTEKRIQVAVQ